MKNIIAVILFFSVVSFSAYAVDGGCGGRRRDRGELAAAIGDKMVQKWRAYSALRFGAATTAHPPA